MRPDAPTRRGLFAGAALVTILSTPFAAMAAAPLSEIPRLDKKREKLKAYLDHKAVELQDEELQELMDELHGIEDRIADAPCLSKADAVAKLRLVAQADEDDLQGWEGAICEEVIAFLLRH
jgi:hypothetical protein